MELTGDSKVIVSYIKDPAQLKEELKNDGYNEEELAKIAGLS